LDAWYQHYQEAQVQEQILSHFSEAHRVEGESYFSLEGDTWREIGWFASLAAIHPLAVKYTIDQALGMISWPELFNQLPLVANAWVNHQGVYAHFDLLVYYRKTWHGVLLRSSNKVKDVHIAEGEFNRAIFNRAGISMGSVYVVHPAENYQHYDAAPLKVQYCLHNLNASIKHLRTPLSAGINQIIGDAAQGVACGRRQCGYCAPQLPQLPYHHIYTLHKGGKAVKLFESEGILDLHEAHRGSASCLMELTEKHQVQIKAIQQATALVNVQAIRQFLAQVEYPLHCIDFECYSQAIPRFPKTHPWELVAFLVSVHCVDNHNDQEEQPTVLIHGEPGCDARRQIAEALCASIGPTGSVLGYGMALERTVINRFMTLFPEHKIKLKSILDRMVDLQEPFFNFDYYHPEQRGKISLKVILPLLSGFNHANLALQSGGQAHLFWAYLSDPQLRPLLADRDYLSDIKTYAALDARGLVAIYLGLRKLIDLAPV
jgi:hypothetical protein